MRRNINDYNDIRETITFLRKNGDFEAYNSFISDRSEFVKKHGKEKGMRMLREKHKGKFDAAKKIKNRK